MSEPKELNWNLVKRILRYLLGTVGYGLGYSFFMASLPVVGSIRKQNLVSLSIVEVEYKEEAIASCEELWLRRILEDIIAYLVDL